MIQTSDIHEAALHLWNASQTLRFAVPGGLHMGRVPERGSDGAPVQAPYVSLTVDEGQPLWTATPGYVQPFTVNLRIYSDQQAEPTGEIMRAADAALNFGAGRTVALDNGQDLHILHSNRLAGELKQDDRRRKAEDVLVASCRYEMLCQGTQP